MGCCGSSASGGSEHKVTEGRRRLSVGNVEAATGPEAKEGEEQDRGFITKLAAEKILDIVDDHGGGRKMSVGSETDEGKTSFANKTIAKAGEELNPAEKCLGYTCRKGLKPESPNQDSWFMLEVDKDFTMYGVFDGHGQKGHDVSNFVKDNLPKLIVKDNRFKTKEMPAMLKDTFMKMQNLIGVADRTKTLSASMSGTTATFAVHDQTSGQLTVAHVADSTAVLGKLGGANNQSLTAVQLTRDHKPNLKDERQRIEKSGGRVVFDGYANHRVYAKNGRYPGLNMSRCLGDLMGHQDCGITAEPEVLEHKIDSSDYVLLLCSDGVWEFITPIEAVTIVHEYGPKRAMEAAEKLAKEAWDRWIKEEGGAVVDDITVVCAFLNQQPSP